MRIRFVLNFIKKENSLNIVSIQQCAEGAKPGFVVPFREEFLHQLLKVIWVVVMHPMPRSRHTQMVIIRKHLVEVIQVV